MNSELLKWYNTHGRRFPWRRTQNPYRIWLSEIMCQQTQADRVVPFYNRFLKRFPNVQSLATANWRTLHPYWRGLGYYQRGRNLLAAARVIHERGFPKCVEELRGLPGVGPYTANAIASFSFGVRAIALDTNLRRVGMRFYGCSAEDVERQLLGALKRARSSEFNQALMDLGALICRAAVPRCGECPLQRRCSAYRTGRLKEGSQVRRGSRPRVRGAIDVGVACIHREDGAYLIGQRSRARGGVWEFPGGKREPGEDIRGCIQREIAEEIGVEVSVRPPFLVSIMEAGEQKFRLHFCRCQIQRGRPKANEHQRLQWVRPEELFNYPFPEANREAVAKLLQMKRK